MALDTNITIYDPEKPLDEQLTNEQPPPPFDNVYQVDPTLGRVSAFKHKFTYDPLKLDQVKYKISCVVSYFFNLQSAEGKHSEEKTDATEISRAYQIESEYVEIPESIINEEAVLCFDNLEQVAKYFNNY